MSETYTSEEIAIIINGAMKLQQENTELKEAFNLAYDHLCDFHFNLTQPIAQGSGHIKTVIKELEKTAKSNRLFIEKKKEEG